MNINGKQLALIVGAIVSVLMVSTTQLTDLFGVGVTKYIVSSAGLINLMINSVMAALTGTVSQTTQVQQVLDMTGVKRLEVNKDASPALALMAVDQNVDKIAPAPEAVRAVEATATAATKAA